MSNSYLFKIKAFLSLLQLSLAILKLSFLLSVLLSKLFIILVEARKLLPQVIQLGSGIRILLLFSLKCSFSLEKFLPQQHVLKLNLLEGISLSSKFNSSSRFTIPHR